MSALTFSHPSTAQAGLPCAISSAMFGPVSTAMVACGSIWCIT